MSRLLLALCGAVLIAGCGSSTTPTTAGSSSQAGQSSSAAAGGALGNLVVSGSLSLTVAEGSNSANKCQPGSGNTITGQLVFDAYVLQLGVPIGTTTFPNTTGQSGVAFYNGNDSQQEWSIGSSATKTAVSMVTMSADGKNGTIDADMLPNTPRPNPALRPIHVKGTFTCQ